MTELQAQVGVFLHTLEQFPDETRALLVETAAAGPEVRAKRDRVLEEVARYLEDLDAARFPSTDDAYAIVAAAVEVIAHQTRTGRPMPELEPVIGRLLEPR